MKSIRLFAVVAIACFSTTVSAAEIRPDAKLVYKTVGEVKLKLHTFYPANHKPGEKRPCIVFFFGGGWRGGTPKQFYPHCKHLAAKGMVAYSAEYRVSSKHKTTPKECVKDGKSAVRWIRQHAEQLGIDPQRVAAGGGSAGGHVAAAAGTLKKFDEKGEDLSVSSRPDALVLFNPVYDNGPGGYGHDRVKDYWQDISPLHNIDARTPPTIVFMGTRDQHVPQQTAIKYRDLMHEAGRRCELYLYEGQPHGFFNYRGGSNRYYDETVEQMDRFLSSLGYLKANVDTKK